MIAPDLVIRAVGEPSPVGSFFGRVIGEWLDKRTVRDPRAIVVPDNKKSKPWRDAVIVAAKSAMRACEFEWVPLAEAVEVEMTFWLARGKTVRRLLPWVRPDVDKYARNSIDGLTEAKVWLDDGQVTDLIARKRYCGPGQKPGARIVVRPVEAVSI